MSSRNTIVKDCILCETFNTLMYFGICVRCHLKIDDAMGYCISDVKVQRESKGEIQN